MSDRRTVDELIFPEWIAPVDPDTLLHEHCLVVDGGRILAVQPTATANANYTPRQTTELPGHLLIPGLVNSHTHAAMTLFRGMADDLPLMEWLEGHIWPAERRWVGHDFVLDGTELAAAEMLRGGTTCFADMYFFPDAAAEAAKRCGIRLAVGLVVAEFPSAWAADSTEYLRRAAEVHDALRDEPLVTTLFAPHSTYAVDEGTLRRIATLAEELDLQVQIHAHESSTEVAMVEARFGARPLEVLSRNGLLSNRLLAVHATQLLDQEIAVLAQQGASVIHCPESNMKLASGACPVAHLLSSGITVALGTDGAASNNNLDLLGEMRSAALLGKAVAADAAAVSARQVLGMATLGGARALGLADEIGSLVPGKSADCVAVDLSPLNCQPVHDPVSQLVYAAHATQVREVWVAGRRRLTNGRLVAGNEATLRDKAERWRQLISGA